LQGILEKGMPGYTPHTIVSVGPFLADVERIRARGYAVSEEEFESDINAIAAPVLGAEGRPVASVSIAGPAYRLRRERILEMAPHLLANVNELTHEIQHSDLAGADLIARAVAAARNAG
jgi:DNA-binding IclR family transcriptional regulator